MFEIFIIVLICQWKCPKIVENVAMFLNFQNLILVISVLTNRIRDSTIGIGKCDILLCTISYKGFTSCNILFHHAIKMILHSAKCNITVIFMFISSIVSLIAFKCLIVLCYQYGKLQQILTDFVTTTPFCDAHIKSQNAVDNIYICSF